MTRLAAFALTACLVTAPAFAQDVEEEGRSLMERGADLFFRGLMDELDPAFRELQDLAEEMEPALRSFGEEMGPALRELMGQVKDWSNYEPPEMLPNGDIILRRKQTAEPPLPKPYGDGPEIEL